jgi:hypothetical protein
LILTAVFVAGLIGGVLVAVNAPPEFSEKIIAAAAGFLRSRSVSGFSETLAESFFSAVLTVLVLFLLGFGAIYQPVSVIVIAFRGLGIGTALCFLYAGEITLDNFVAAVSVLPFLVLTSFIHILACRESLRFSTSILRVSNALPGEYQAVDYSLYINKFIIMMFITGVVSVIDALINLAV